jgi:hypothetical protein
MISETKTKTKTKPKLPLSATEELYKEYNNSLDFLSSIGKEIGFEVERNKDYGAGTIDVIWNMTVYPALPVMKCGFIKLKAEERGSKEDNQFSIRKIEEAAIRGIRSGMDKIYLVADNEDMAKSISGKIEWLASFGSLLRLDAISLGIFPAQQDSAIITPSQKRVHKREKIRKQQIKKRGSAREIQ